MIQLYVYLKTMIGCPVEGNFKDLIILPNGLYKIPVDDVTFDEQYQVG